MQINYHQIFQCDSEANDNLEKSLSVRLESNPIKENDKLLKSFPIVKDESFETIEIPLLSNS